MASHTHTDRDGDPNVFNLNRDEAQLKLNANNAKPSNRWNSDNQFVFRLRTSFFFRTFVPGLPSMLQGAVFLFWIFEALFPAPKYSANFFEFVTDVGILRMTDKLAFPCGMNEEFQCIEYKNTLDDIFRFLFLFAKIGDIRKFEKVEESVFNPDTDSIACAFWNMPDNIQPQQISLFDALEYRGVFERERERERVRGA